MTRCMCQCAGKESGDGFGLQASAAHPCDVTQRAGELVYVRLASNCVIRGWHRDSSLRAVKAELMLERI